MAIPPRFVSDVQDRLTLSNIIGRKVKLTRAGREFKACCPFHKEKSPSFYVNDDKGFYHCFGCGAHGDAVGFLMRHDNLSFIEAVEILASDAGMPVPQQSPEEVQKYTKDKSLYALLEDTAKFFEQNLFAAQNSKILDYLKKRGLSDEIIASFRIGFAPRDEQALKKFLKEKGFDEPQMLEAGVIKNSTTGRDSYAFFRDRVIFPVTDMRGRVIAFGGRILPDYLKIPERDPNFKPPKYINSADTNLFHKGRNLYAQQHARQMASDQDVLVVEGYMDVIALHQAGFKTATAPLGTALTEEQISLLWRITPQDVKQPILCFDGDNSGYRAAMRAAERVLPLLKPNHSLRFCFLPEGEDPDTFILNKGRKAFQNLIQKSLSVTDFLWTHHTAGKDFGSPELKAGLEKTLENMASRITDGSVQYHFKRAFKDKIFHFFRNTTQANTVGKSTNIKNNFLKKPQNNISLKPVKSRGEILPQILLSLILNHPWIYSEIEHEFFELYPDQEDLRALHDEMLDFFTHENLENQTAENLKNFLIQKNYDALVEKLNSQSVLIHAPAAKQNQDPEIVRAAWSSFWESWEKSKLMNEIGLAHKELKMAMTLENEQKLSSLKAQNIHFSNESDDF